MLPRSLVALALSLLLLAFLPAEGSAQLGKLRQKAKDAVTKAAVGSVTGTTTTEPERAAVDPAAQPAAQPVAEAPAASGAGEDLTFTEPLADRFQAALEAEVKTAKEQEARHMELFACMGKVQDSAEGKAIMERFNQAAADGDMERVEAAQRELGALNVKACGEDPTAPDFHDTQSGKSVGAALAAGAFEDRAYAWLKERIAPFCYALEGERAGGEPAPTDGFTADEVTVLRARCEALYPLLSEV